MAAIPFLTIGSNWGPSSSMRTSRHRSPPTLDVTLPPAGVPARTLGSSDDILTFHSPTLPWVCPLAACRLYPSRNGDRVGP